MKDHTSKIILDSTKWILKENKKEKKANSELGGSEVSVSWKSLA